MFRFKQHFALGIEVEILFVRNEQPDEGHAIVHIMQVMS